MPETPTYAEILKELCPNVDQIAPAAIGAIDVIVAEMSRGNLPTSIARLLWRMNYELMTAGFTKDEAMTLMTAGMARLGKKG